MDPLRSLSRRRVLVGQAAALGLVATAGCTDRDGAAPSDGTASATDGAAPATDGPGSETHETPDSGDLDLREANVVGVAVDGGSGTYEFDVTLHHDDDGEDGYANWWQVERLDGTRLDRRQLAHPHAEQPFTRSDTVDVPAAVTCVAVRGHDQTHGYGGVAAVVAIDDGAVQLFDQGADRRSFDAEDCP